MNLLALVTKGTYTNCIIVCATACLMFLILGNKHNQRDTGGFSIETPVVDLGRIRVSSKPISFKLRIVNNTEKKLIISGISASCGCTNGGIEGSKTLEPKQTVPLDVSFRIGERTGKVQSSLVVQATSEDGKFMEAKSKIQAYGINIVQCEPKTLHLGTNYLGETSNHATLVLSKGEDPTLWDGLVCESKDLDTLVSLNKSGAYEITVSAKPVMSTIGSGSCDLNIYPSWRGERIASSKITIPTVWEVSHRHIFVQPSLIYLGILRQNTVYTGSTLITTDSSDPLLGVATTVSNQIEAVLFSNSNRIECRYKFFAGTNTGSFSSIIEATVMFAGIQYKVRTPIVGYVK